MIACVAVKVLVSGVRAEESREEVMIDPSQEISHEAVTAKGAENSPVMARARSALMVVILVGIATMGIPGEIALMYTLLLAERKPSVLVTVTTKLY